MKNRRPTLVLSGFLVVGVLIVITTLMLIGAKQEESPESTPPCVAVLAPVPIPADRSQITPSKVLDERCPETWEEFVEFSSGGALDVSPDIKEQEALRVLYDYNDQLMEDVYATQTHTP
jgi:hypothetical protein